MTSLNLSKSRFLMPALQNLIVGLTKLSKSDSALNKRIYDIHHFIASPEDVNGEDLIGTINAAKDLASGYELDKETKALPVIFQGALSELDHLLRSKKLTDMDGKFAVVKNIGQFHKLAIEDLLDEETFEAYEHAAKTLLYRLKVTLHGTTKALHRLKIEQDYSLENDPDLQPLPSDLSLDPLGFLRKLKGAIGDVEFLLNEMKDTKLNRVGKTLWKLCDDYSRQYYGAGIFEEAF